MPAVALRAGAQRRSVASATDALRIALLGLGTIGSAVADLAAASAHPWRMRVTGALVRDVTRARRVNGVRLVTDARTLLVSNPDVVVEALGGIQPARALVIEALERRIPVVTANKSLMAACGDDLLDLAARRATPLLYEACVLAGVPCLGAFGRRPHAAVATAIAGVVNGTSNFILGRMEETSLACAAVLAEAQQRGLAEPDPRNDLLGIDAAEKLVVLARHFRLGSFQPSAVETAGITSLRANDFVAAREFGGVIKPIVHASRDGACVRGYSGPAFLPSAHTLSRVNGSDNAIVIRNRYGDLVYAGPGAGPVATATTVLDDVADAMRGWDGLDYVRSPAVRVLSPTTAWLVRLADAPLPQPEELADLLASHGVWPRRSTDVRSPGEQPSRHLLTYACPRERIAAALSAVEAATGCATFSIRTLEC